MTKEMPVKCRSCKKAPKNCECVEYRLELAPDDTPWYAVVYADNIATEPARGESVGTWQPRANARVWRRPQFVDGYPILYLTDATLVDTVKHEINAGSFNVFNYEGVDNARLVKFPKDHIRRFSFLRRSRRRAGEQAEAA